MPYLNNTACRLSRTIGNLIPLFFLLNIGIQVHGQNVSSNNWGEQKTVAILQKILQLQSNGDGYYKKGAFPSQRKYFWGKQLKEDDNLFFTAIVLYQLERYKGLMNQEELLIAQQIRTQALPYFTQFQNAQKRPTFNFWQKNPPVIFPNGGWLNHYNKTRALPDDIDDCALAALAMGSDFKQVDSMKRIFVQYKNTQLKSAKSFYTKYKNAPVYSTWLGSKFPIDIDICVLSNVLVMNYATNTKFNSTDSASLQLIIQLVRDNKHIKDPRFVSQHYQNTPNILYHLARLIHYTNDRALQALKPLLIIQIKEQLNHVHSALAQLILKNALLQLGMEGPDLTFTNTVGLYQKDYSFFIANMSAVLNNPFKRLVSFSRIGTFNYYSDAFNLSLVLENIWLNRKAL